MSRRWVGSSQPSRSRPAAREFIHITFSAQGSQPESSSTHSLASSAPTPAAPDQRAGEPQAEALQVSTRPAARCRRMRRRPCGSAGAAAHRSLQDSTEGVPALHSAFTRLVSGYRSEFVTSRACRFCRLQLQILCESGTSSQTECPEAGSPSPSTNPLTCRRGFRSPVSSTCKC